MQKSVIATRDIKPATVLVAVVCFVLVALFVITRGFTPATSELSFVEQSILGASAGSVVPASCDSYSLSQGVIAGSHSPGDCQVICADGINYYDPYFDPNGTDCPVVSCPAGTVYEGGMCKTPKVELQFGSAYPFLYINKLALESESGTVDGKISMGESAYLRWNVSGATSCYGTGMLYNKPITLPTGQFFYDNPFRVCENGISGTYNSNFSASIVCTNGSEELAKTINVMVSYQTCKSTSACFIAGTQVTMADGSKRNIESVSEGEYLMTPLGPDKVTKVWRINYKGDLYAFNESGNYFFTPQHPFMTTEGWKSFDPDWSRRENPGLEVSLLKIGDTLILEDGSTMMLESVDKKYGETMVYSYSLGARSFYADGFWVHNNKVLE